jgi:RNA polymerase sigma factor (sigma-70 family)
LKSRQLVEDEQIMRQVRDGEVNRLEVLFDRHHRALLHYFLHLTGNRATSEDLVQEVFFRVLKYRRSYQTENTFRAWLFQIGRNAYLDHLGRRKNEAAWPAEAPEAASPDAAPDRLMEEKAGNRAAAPGAGRAAAGEEGSARDEPLSGFEIRGNRRCIAVRGRHGEGARLPGVARTGRPFLRLAGGTVVMNCEDFRQQLPECLAGRLAGTAAGASDRAPGRLFRVP